MSIELPIKLKHFTVDLAVSTLLREGDLPVQLYSVINNETGLIEFQHQVLADTYNQALSMDINMNHAVAYYEENKDGFNHLKVADVEAAREEDPLEGLMLPGEAKIERLN